ncbi:hypothetical protein QA646_08820 [Rhizobium sp. CB3090]|uniref:hypothetical protein n=1 Tax=Rhizobium sp. CB3090 TaxID=3039156 RepID=UPI0024B0F108|nr:hypothetical protein [Rhizobium sp. CB3090]WFU10923.1 hypothetical protein QA646_08820 [Rhizobium sp. CB3090]
MKLRIAMLFAALLLFPNVTEATLHGPNGGKHLGSHGQPKADVFAEDLSCRAVDEAVRKTWDSPQLAVNTYNAKPDGSLKPHFESRAIGAEIYEKYAFSTKWRRFRRGVPGSMGQRGPLWNACKLVKPDHAGDQAELHYTATWRSFPYEAAADIWISANDGRLQKIQRRFPDNRWMFPFATALEKFDYDPAHIEVPDAGSR